MTFQSTIITAQEMSFVVVVVDKPIIEDSRRAEQAIAFFQSKFSDMPAVLMTCDRSGRPTSFYGRRDIAPILAKVSPTAVQWTEFSVE